MSGRIAAGTLRGLPPPRPDMTPMYWRPSISKLPGSPEPTPQTSPPHDLAGLHVAQPVFRGTEIFPPEEFAARRARVMAQIGDGVSGVLCTTETPGEIAFREHTYI